MRHGFFFLEETKGIKQSHAVLCRWMPHICGSREGGKAKGVDGWLDGMPLSLRSESRDITWPVFKRLRAVYGSVGFVMSIPDEQACR